MNNEDPVAGLWHAHAVEVARDIEEQMTARAKDGFRPLPALLGKARQKALVAVLALVDIDPNAANAIQRLQNEVRRYDDLVQFTRELVAAGLEAEHDLTDEERADLESLIAPPADITDTEQLAEMTRLGLTPQETNDR
jgi:hypothetical protein